MLTVINVREGSATHDCTMTRVSRLENNLLYLIRQRKLHGKNLSMTNAIDKTAYHSIMLAIEMYLNIATKPSLKDLYNILHIGEICPLHLYDATLHQRVKYFLINLNFPLCVKLIELENWKNKQANRFRNGGLNTWDKCHDELFKRNYQEMQIAKKTKELCPKRHWDSLSHNDFKFW